MKAATPESPVTRRAIAIGLAMVVLIIAMTEAVSIRRSAAEVGGGAPPPAPTYLLFLYIVLLAPWLARRWPKAPLTRGELLLIYVMVLVTGPIAHPYAIGFLVPHTVAPFYFLEQEPNWQAFQSALPRWLGPRDAEVVRDFFRGTGAGVPWGAWLVPMVAWSSLLVALFFVMLSLNVLVRRRWVEHERLVFPLAAIPLGLTEGIGARQGRAALPDLVRRPLFWAGVALPIVLRASGEVAHYVPAVPFLPLRDIVVLDAGTQLGKPWNGLGLITFNLVFWLVGVVYLLPKELALSGWVFYWVARLEDVLAVARGAGQAPSVYTNEFPALFAQGAGAAFALTGVALYSARHDLRAALRHALRRDWKDAEPDEYLSHRTAVWGLFLGSAFILGWCALAGTRLWVAGLLFALILSYFFIFARIRAETGLGMGVILWPKMLNEVLITVVGAHNMRLSDITMLYALRWLYFGSATGAVMACQLEGFRIADAAGARGRRAGWAVVAAMVVAVPLAFAWTLHTYYAHGFEMLPIGHRLFSMVGSQIYWSYADLSHDLSTPAGPDWAGILAMGAGAAVTMALAWLRTSYTWFPLHPIGYLAANSWGMHINWTSFLIGWGVKVCLMRFGGLALYRRSVPLFLGLIVGDMLHQGLWALVGMAFGRMG